MNENGKTFDIRYACMAEEVGTWGSHWEIVCLEHGGVVSRSSKAKEAVSRASELNGAEQRRVRKIQGTRSHPGHTEEWQHDEDHCSYSQVGWRSR